MTSPPSRTSRHLEESDQLKGALVTIDALGCPVAIADKIGKHQADDLLALEGNQPTLEAEVADYIRSAAAAEEVISKITMKSIHRPLTSNSRTTCRDIAAVTRPRLWPSCAASCSASGHPSEGGKTRTTSPGSNPSYLLELF